MSDPEINFHLSRGSQVRDIGSGNFGVAKLMKDKQSGQLVAVKFIERGEKVRFKQASGPCYSRSSLLPTNRDPEETVYLRYRSSMSNLRLTALI